MLRLRTLLGSRRSRSEGTVLEAGLASFTGGEAEVLLAYVAWDRGEGERVRGHLTRAEELVGSSISPSMSRKKPSCSSGDRPRRAWATSSR